MLCCHPVWAKDLDLSCLSRPQREEIAVCFLQNEACHKSLESAPAEIEKNSWKNYVIAALLGVAGGFALARAR